MAVVESHISPGEGRGGFGRPQPNPPARDLSVARFIPDELAERAARVLQPHSGAATVERREATLVLRAYRRQQVNARVGRWALHQERFVEEDQL